MLCPYDMNQTEKSFSISIFFLKVMVTRKNLVQIVSNEWFAKGTKITREVKLYARHKTL